MPCDSVMHQLHMCALQALDKQELIDALTDQPTVSCQICGAQANDPRNLCSPWPIAERD